MSKPYLSTDSFACAKQTTATGKTSVWITLWFAEGKKKECGNIL
jgi:hypothetical protein